MQITLWTKSYSMNRVAGSPPSDSSDSTGVSTTVEAGDEDMGGAHDDFLGTPVGTPLEKKMEEGLMGNVEHFEYSRPSGRDVSEKHT
jgi:hypothetical protein